MIQWMTDNIFAHRGFHSKPEIPENSLPAFRRAAERGWGAEFDVHLLSDGTLAIFHDSELERCTGVKGNIEALDFEKMRKLRLEGTDEVIPTFDEVLDIFEHSDNRHGNPCPLIIELKPVGNIQALVRAVCDRLDSYKGDFCIECFDPRALIALKQYRPEIVRGQLAQDFLIHDVGLPWYQRRMLANLWWDKITKPDFVAYQFSDRKNRALRRETDKKGIQEVSWTIRSKKEFDAAIAAGCVPIFEGFDPEKD